MGPATGHATVGQVAVEDKGEGSDGFHMWQPQLPDSNVAAGVRVGKGVQVGKGVGVTLGLRGPMLVAARLIAILSTTSKLMTYQITRYLCEARRRAILSVTSIRSIGDFAL